MPGKTSLKIIGDWRKEIGVPLRDALHVSMDVMGRTGEQAARHALILMAQSARAITKQSPKNRRMLRDEHGQYVENRRAGRRDIQKLYKWMFDASDRQSFIGGTWENARLIGNRGLAKKSWMWGLGRLGAKRTTKQISGTSKVRTITSEKANGYIKQNLLDYILKAMPSGWERTVEMRAGNKIMAQARKKMERRFKRDVEMQRRAVAGSVSRFFLKGLA